MRKMSMGIVLGWIVAVSMVCAQEAVDLSMITRLKEEGFKNSRVMETAAQLTDVYGGRLTGSTAFMEAARWCRDQLESWGLSNAHLEPWGVFGRGWEVERFSAEVTTPFYMNLNAYPKAWTAGTDSLISGTPIVIDVDADDLEQYRGQLAGKIVMLGGAQELEAHMEAEATRYDADKLKELAMAAEPRDRERSSPEWEKRRARYRKRRAAANFLKEENAAVSLEASGLQDGTLRVMSGGSRGLQEKPGTPALVVAAEQYNRIARLMKRSIPVTLSIEIHTRFLNEDSLGYNVVAELPGTDRKLRNEVVMLGAHLDSWHSGSGATDNAAGSAVMMEAMRILKAVDARPRRTIRLALWSGEEEGLLGSEGYVKKHFGDPKTMELKPEFERLSAYYNIDNGGGKIRGIYLQENDAARPILEAMLAPFRDLGVETISIRNTGGTDHMAFDQLGLPGFQFIQDPLDYFQRTWHTNMDVYDHLQAADLMQISVVVASVVYHTAMREDRIPRKPRPKPSTE